jgi:hypothetical protein
MADFQLTCVIQERGVITQVGVEGTIYTVQRIIGAMNAGDTFYTYKYGYRAKVYQKQSSITGRIFLTTDPDDTRENNLDFLPTC